MLQLSCTFGELTPRVRAVCAILRVRTRTAKIAALAPLAHVGHGRDSDRVPVQRVSAGGLRLHVDHRLHHLHLPDVAQVDAALQIVRLRPFT